MHGAVQAYPQQKVAVFVQRGKGGLLSVVEYSGLDAAMTTEMNQTTVRLRYCWSNACLHMFPLDFLSQVTVLVSIAYILIQIYVDKLKGQYVHL